MKTILYSLCVVLITSCMTTARFNKTDAVSVNHASGFKMDHYIVTCNHVADGTFVLISDFRGEEFTGVVVARDLVNDICLIKYPKSKDFVDYTPAGVHIGQKVYCIGNPLGLSYSEMSGEVQAVNRTQLNGGEAVQLSLDGNYGASGAPVFDSRGRLVGVAESFIPGTRFTFIIPIQKVVLLIKKTRQKEPH